MGKLKSNTKTKKTQKDKFPKTSTGITGLDEIMMGGFPQGRPVLICGSAGCGKTLMAAQFIVKGITEHNEPGVFMSFEESSQELSENVRSLGFDLEKLKADKMLRVDFVHVERSEISETGEYDLEGLFIRLNHAIDSIGAKRVVLDTLEAIFAGVDNESILRSEIRRLFRWLKEKGVTAVVTGERGENSLTRQGLEEYVSDCVILLDFRIIDQIATRRLRIIKYRGSTHGTNEYPFLIDEDGISVLPITSLKLDFKASDIIISSGLSDLDKLFERGGMFKGNSILITGSAGTAKTTIASYFAIGACKRKEKVLYITFEESPEQIIRNMKSVGMNLSQYVKSGLLKIHATRPTLQGLEMHLIIMQRLIEQYKPETVIIDPISSLISIGSGSEVRGMLVRAMDLLKARSINSVFTSLTQVNQSVEKDATIDAVSSLSDTWISLRNENKEGKRVRSLIIIKSRGMGHSSQENKFTISEKGIRITKN